MQPFNTTPGVASSFNSAHLYQEDVGRQWDKSLSNPHSAGYRGLGNAICSAQEVGVQLVGHGQASR